VTLTPHPRPEPTDADRCWRAVHRAEARDTRHGEGTSDACAAPTAALRAVLEQASRDEVEVATLREEVALLRADNGRLQDLLDAVDVPELPARIGRPDLRLVDGEDGA
jgi:hypothetical protein